MKAITKLTAVALAAVGIAGGVAVAQGNAGTESTMNPETANYGTPPGAPLKRDSSLSASGAETGVVTDNGATSTTTTTNTTSSTDSSSSAAAPAPMSSDTSSTDTSTGSTAAAPQPRSDRN